MNTEGDQAVTLCAFAFLLTFLANTVDLEAVAGGNVPVLAADLLLDAFDVGREKFHRAAAMGTDQMMMIASLVLVFVTGDAVLEGDLAG